MLRQVKAWKPARLPTPKRVDSSAAHHKRRRQRTNTCNRALADDSRDEPVDIDQLAKRLSQEAERVRQQDQQKLDEPSVTESGDDFAASFAEAVRNTEDRAQTSAETSSPFGFEVSSFEHALRILPACSPVLLHELHDMHSDLSMVAQQSAGLSQCA